MPSEYRLPNANIEVTGVMNDGRPFRLNTKGDVVVRTKKDPWANDYRNFQVYEPYLPTMPENYELVADLEYDKLRGAVFTIKIEKQRVTRSVTADLGQGVDISALRKRLKIPAEATVKFREKRTRVEFSWEEEIQ